MNRHRKYTQLGDYCCLLLTRELLCDGEGDEEDDADVFGLRGGAKRLCNEEGCRTGELLLLLLVLLLLLPELLFRREEG